MFNYTELYNFCYNWFKKDEDYLLYEEEYLEKLAGGAKEVKIKWKAEKKITDYYQFVFELKWHIIGMTDAEAEENGKKVKTNKGDLTIEVKAKLKRDYEETWDKKPFWKFLRGIYDRYIMRTTQDQYEIRLMQKAQEFVANTKAFLNMEGKE